VTRDPAECVDAAGHLVTGAPRDVADLLTLADSLVHQPG
jgi:hypothetical protein